MSDQNRPIVVGIDGSEGALAAARWAACLAARIGAPLHLVHGRPDAGPTLTDPATALRAAVMTYVDEHAAEILETAGGEVRAQEPGLEVTTTRLDWSAEECLLDASRWAKFVVLGSETVSPVAAVLLGSTTVAVAARARCPIILARGAGSEPSGAPVVVGVDYSNAGDAALEVAFEMAEYRQVGIEAIHILSQPIAMSENVIPTLVDWTALESAESARLSDAVDKVARRHPNVKAQSFLECHRPAEALLRHSFGAQMVVVGTRGHGALSGMALGSTSLNLMHNCRIPLMICHPAP